MDRIRALSLSAAILRIFRKPLLVVASWLTAVGIGTGCFAYSAARSVTDELLAFACSFAVAAPIASVIPLIFAGKKNWAVEATLAIASAIVVFAGVVYLFLWAAPSLVRSQMGYWELLRLRHLVLFVAESIAILSTVLGAIVGSVIGAIASLVVVLSRRIPKLATCLMAGLLLACASGPVHGFVFGLATDLVLKWRLEGGKWAVSSISEKELGSGLGSTIGAVFGAVLAVTVTRVSRNWSRPSCGAQPASALPDQTGPNVV